MKGRIRDSDNLKEKKEFLDKIEKKWIEMEKQERESNLKHGIELVPPGKDLKLTIWTHELTE